MAAEPGNTTTNVTTPSGADVVTMQASAEGQNNQEYKLSFQAQPEHGEYTFDEKAEEFYSEIEVQAPLFEPETRPSVDVVAVLDVSGSMSIANKISLVRKSMRRLLRSLSSKDRVAFVTFDDHVNVLMDFISVTEENRILAMGYIDKLKPGSRTALCGGVVKGIEELLANRMNEVAAVLLFTDGEANVGIKDTAGIINKVSQLSSLVNSSNNANLKNKNVEKWTVEDVGAWLLKIQLGMYGQAFKENQIDGTILKHDLTTEILMEDLNVKRVHIPKFMRQLKKLENGNTNANEEGEGEEEENQEFSGFRLHTFGYGTDHNKELLEGLADHFEGMYHFVETEEMIKEVFASCLGGLLSTVAQDIELKIQFNPEVTNAKVHKDIGLEIENDVYTVTFADLQSEEKRNILISCDLPPKSESDPDYVLYEVEFQYRNAMDNSVGNGVFQCTLNRSGQIAHLNESVDQTKNRFLTANALKEATRLGNNHKIEACQQLLAKTLQQVSISPSVHKPECQGMQSDLQTALKRCKDQRTFRDQGAHYMDQSRICMTQQRCANFEPVYRSQNLYGGFTREVLRNQWDEDDEFDS